MLPPPWLRRLVLGPAFVLLTVGVLTAVPLLAIVAAFLSPIVPGRWRPLRLLCFVLVYLIAESFGLVVAWLFWVASGFGRMLERPRFTEMHYELLRSLLRVIVGAARRLFRLRLDITHADPAFDGEWETVEPVPLVVLSRHAGPGDSLLLVHELLQSGQRPRIVLKSVLQWEPFLDVMLNRLPSVFVGGAIDAVEGIRAVAEDMQPGDALVLFPEGGNFTEARRLRSIAKLDELGQHGRAEQARQMRHVLAPRIGGTAAALAVAPPTTDVVIVAHTGLEDLSGLVDLWRGLPMDAAIEIAVWRAHPDDMPERNADHGPWLFAWFKRIDSWILERKGPSAVPDAVADEMGGDGAG